MLNDTEHKGRGFTTHAKNLLQGGSTGLIGESNCVKQINARLESYQPDKQNSNVIKFKDLSVEFNLISMHSFANLKGSRI